MKRARRFCSISARLLALLAAVLTLAAAPAAEAAVRAEIADSASHLEEALLSVSINGSPAGEPAVLLRGAADEIYASAELIGSWRLRFDRRPAFTRGGTAYYRLSDIAGLKLELVEATQMLAIHADPNLLAQTRLSYPELELGEEVVSGSGAFLNYEASGQFAGGLVTGGGAIEAGVFTSKGTGITGFVGRWTDEGPEFVRLDTNWTIDDPARMRSLRLGDSISRGGVGGAPLRFAGIQLARNFSVQPGFVTVPLPSVSGSAALPSVVDVYVDGALRDSRDLPPGPFEITDVPIVTGGGDVQLVVRDLLGREALYNHSYYAAPALLREGLHDFSYELGFLRRSFGLKSNDYGPLMLSATHRYGFSERLTGEAHVVATGNVQSAGVAANLVVADAAHVGVSIAGSRSELGAGALAGVTVERRSRGLSLGIKGEFTTDAFMALNWSLERRPPKSVIQGFAGIPTDFGSLGLSYLRRDARSEPDSEFVSANTSFRLGRLGSVHLAGRKDLKHRGGLAAELTLTMPLGPRESASAGASRTGGRFAVRSSVQRKLPLGQGWGYRIDSSAGAFKRIDGKVSLQTSFGLHEAQLSWTDRKTGVRLSTAGGLGMIGGDAFASRQLTQSFATVVVGGYKNVRVYADNQLVGRTAANGRLVIPRLRPYERNRLRIEVADLPMDAEVSGEEKSVRPYNRHGVEVDFAVKPARAAILRILLEDGSPLPVGSTVKLADGSEEFVSAPGGEVYMTGLGPLNTAKVTTANNVCQVEFPFHETVDPQPRLGDFRCRRVVR